MSFLNNYFVLVAFTNYKTHRKRIVEYIGKNGDINLENFFKSQIVIGFFLRNFESQHSLSNQWSDDLCLILNVLNGMRLSRIAVNVVLYNSIAVSEPTPVGQVDNGDSVILNIKSSVKRVCFLREVQYHVS